MGLERTTQRQQRVLDFVRSFLAEKGFPPSLREIGQAVGLANINAVRGHVAALERKGYISREADKARSLRLLQPSPSAFSRFKRRLHDLARTDEGVVSQVVYGLAWTTRGRAPYLTGPRAAAMRRAMEAEAAEHGWSILDLRIQPDRVAVVVQTWPNHSADQTVRRFQAAAKLLYAGEPPHPAARLWAKGYVATTDPDLLDELAERLLGEQGGLA